MNRFSMHCALVCLLFAACSASRLFAADEADAADSVDMRRLRERVSQQEWQIAWLEARLAAIEGYNYGEDDDPWGLRNDPNYLPPSRGGLLHWMFLRIDDELGLAFDSFGGAGGERDSAGIVESTEDRTEWPPRSYAEYGAPGECVAPDPPCPE